MMRSIVALVVGGLLSISAVPAQAQDAILGQTYGNGVHAYFAGDYVKAHELLTKAIDAGSHDPRCYYFRGLAYLQLGRPQEAECDFQQGAKLEIADLNRTYNVARSLERVQGAARLEVEEHRAAARMAKLEQDGKMRKQRYEELNREERRALESQVGPPAAKGGSEPVVAPQPNATDNPFSNTPAAGSGERPAEGPEKASRNRPPRRRSRAMRRPSPRKPKMPICARPREVGGEGGSRRTRHRTRRAGQEGEHLGRAGSARPSASAARIRRPPASRCQEEPPRQIDAAAGKDAQNPDDQVRFLIAGDEGKGSSNLFKEFPRGQSHFRRTKIGTVPKLFHRRLTQGLLAASPMASRAR